jgi:predicted metal-dependent phosphoesterase TrpH
MAIDLHTHSRRSDGTDAPAVLVAGAAAAGLAGVALTDHDTVDGWDEAAAAMPAGMALVRGAEFSTHLVRDGRVVSVHLLGYLFDPTERALAGEMARLRSDRLTRGLAIVDRMVAGGVPISREQVLEIAAGAPVGRPHIGRALMHAGLVDSVSAAFASYLSGSGPYYVAKADTDLVDGIALVRGAGGAAVLAHPGSRGAARIMTETLLADLAAAGLTGLEVDHPDHDPGTRLRLRTAADRLGLIATGASDYHGTNKRLRIGQDTTDRDTVGRLADATSGVTAVLGWG